MKRVVICLALTVVLFCGAFAPHLSIAQSSKELTLYTNALKRYLIYGDTTVARRLVEQALEFDSAYMPARHLLSRLETDPTKALEAAEIALSADTTNTHLLQRVSELSLRATKYDRAKQILLKLTKDSQNPDHFRLLAILHNMSKERQQALAVIDSAEVRLGKMDYFEQLRQQIYIDGGEYEKALNCALEMVESAPYDPANHLALADVYAATGVDSLAKVSFNKAISLDQTNPTAWFEYARFLDSRSLYTEMLLAWRSIVDLEAVPLPTKLSIIESLTSKRDFYRKHFLLIEPIIVRMYELYPDKSAVVDRYISHLIAGNRVEEAVVLLKKGIAGTEPTLEQLNRIIEIEYYIERTDSVELYLDKGIALYPTHENFWTFKSWLQTQRGDNEGSIQTLNAALKYAKDDKARSSIWGSIGDRYYEMGELKRSDKIYKKAIALDPENVMALNNYAYHMSVEGKNLEYALTLSTKVNKLAPNNATYLDTLAWIYYKLGKYEEAKKIMQQAMSFDKQGSAELALHYGDILDALGNTFLAQTYWRKALERGCAADIIERRIEAQKRRLEENKEVTK